MILKQIMKGINLDNIIINVQYMSIITQISHRKKVQIVIKITNTRKYFNNFNKSFTSHTSVKSQLRMAHALTVVIPLSHHNTLYRVFSKSFNILRKLLLFLNFKKRRNTKHLSVPPGLAIVVALFAAFVLSSGCIASSFSSS